MTFLIICKDKENLLQKRLNNRSSHLKYLKSLGDKLILAGPIIDKGGNPCGSILILDFKDIKKVNTFIQNDPYSRVNLFKSVKIINFKKVL
tara:strand:+ start:2653 stop:2925 length:273 start_codon:yes stop_codon:yes gene_type:complete